MKLKSFTCTSIVFLAALGLSAGCGSSNSSGSSGGAAGASGSGTGGIGGSAGAGTGGMGTGGGGMDAGTGGSGVGGTGGSTGGTGGSAGGAAGSGGTGGSTGGTGFPCDIAANAGTACVVAYSMARPLFASYTGALFELQRASDSATKDIGVVNGLADTAAASSFCQGTTCHVVTIYDQTKSGLDGVDKNANSDAPVPPEYLTMQAGGKTIPYWGKGYLEAGSRAVGSLGNGGMPVGSVPVTEYEVVGPATGPGVCCTDFGEAESTIRDTGNGHMFAVSLTPNSLCIDVENGGICGRLQGALPPLPGVVLGKTDGVSLFTLKAGGASGSLAPVSGSYGSSCGSVTFKNQKLSCFGYGPMYLEGGLTVGVGGDGSGDGTAFGGGLVDTAFVEGVIIAAQTSDATDNAIQASINKLFGP